MLTPVVVSLLGAAAVDALVLRNSCNLHLSVDGSISGPVGQLSSGQVRAGSGLDSATFTLNGNQITDSMGRGCWWTPPTKVLQCDEGQTPDSGFSVDCNGQVSYNGQTTFYECETDQSDEYNIYLEDGHGINCNTVTLSSDSCRPACPAPQGCPTNLNGNYEFPHLIIPVDSANADTAAGTSYFGEVSSTVSSLFNFDIPGGDAGKQCSLVFLFPKQEDLETSSFTLSGSGALDFASLESPAMQSTTYNNMPGVKQDLGEVTVSPGNSYLIDTFDCPAGQAIGFEIKAVGDTQLRYFQDYNPSPIGLYITVC